MAESPDSPLSSLASDDIADDIASPLTATRPSLDIWQTHDGDALAPPSKRRKTGPSTASPSVFNVHDRAIGYREYDDDESLSEDKEGSAPGSPSHDEFSLKADQITACSWEGCDTGDLGNTDDLVRHVQEAHVNPKRARYTCMWGECARKGTVHPSGYALRAHMRSHTKEKPYFCALPECDRAFTRSDALAKHLRTVHEPEPPKTGANGTEQATGPQKKSGAKIRLSKGSASALANATNATTITTAAQNPHNAGLDPSHPDYDPSPPNDNIQYIPAHHPITGQPGFMITYPPDIHFTQFESEIPANQLMRLLRRQIHWATQDSKNLQTEIDAAELVKAKEWLKKELVLEQVMRKEIETGLARGALTEGEDAGRFRDDVGSILEDLAQSAVVEKPTSREGVGSKTTATGRAGDGGVDRKYVPVLTEHPGSVTKLPADETEEHSRSKTARIAAEIKQAKSQVDDMMAVGALMGLSGGR